VSKKLHVRAMPSWHGLRTDLLDFYVLANHLFALLCDF